MKIKLYEIYLKLISISAIKYSVYKYYFEKASRIPGVKGRF
jgi:hypothetical protein